MIREGLRKLPFDGRDYSHKTVFGSISLPEEYCVPDLIVKDQGATDYCSAFSTCTASESQEKVELCPEYAFAKGKEISGDPDGYGNDLRSACKAHVKYGCIEAKMNQYPYQTTDRSILADYTKWNVNLDYDAIYHAKSSFFSVGANLEDIKQAIYQNKTPVVTGAVWRSTWTYSSGGIIPDVYEENGFGHAFVFKGWKKINGKEYLIAHLSNGTDIGDKGMFYFSDDIIRKECVFGNFVFTDLTKDQAEYYHTNQIRVQMNWLEQMYTILKNMLLSLTR